jgi:hypothetical protein
VGALFVEEGRGDFAKGRVDEAESEEGVIFDGDEGDDVSEHLCGKRGDWLRIDGREKGGDARAESRRVGDLD